MPQAEAVLNLHPNASLNSRILIFNNAVGGHHPIYLKYLIEYWCEHRLPGQLCLLVSPFLLEKHSDILKPSIVAKYGVQFFPMSEQDHAQILSQKSFVRRAIEEWKIIRRYVRELKITHCFLPGIDQFLLLFALGYRIECPVSGIYLRPTFHYPDFGNQDTSLKEKIRYLRQKALLLRALRHPKLKYLFCLDPLAVEHVQKKYGSTKLIHLPDPVHQYKTNSSYRNLLKQKLGISEHQKVLLLFGALNQRKGIYQVIDALKKLSDQHRAKLCLLLVGAVSSSERSRLKAEIEELPSTQILLHDEYVSESQVVDYFDASDVVLAPYQKHVGMSGILLIAAAMQKPVLSSDYGLMGELVRRYQLGVAVDSTDPSQIANALTDFLSKSPQQFCHAQKMQQFVEEHDASKFAPMIFDRLLTHV
jgi:glycosyltransferase involved in cell wall biosynthesis